MDLKEIAMALKIPMLSTGGFAALLIVLLMGGSILWQAITKEIAEKISTWLKGHSRALLLLFLCIVPILACVAASNFYAAGLVIIATVGIWILNWAGRLTWRLRWLAVAYGAFFVTALGVDYYVMSQKEMKIYVVMPLHLYGGAGADLDTPLKLSRILRDTVGMNFGKEIQVQPIAYRELQDLDNWREIEGANKRLNYRGRHPIIFLRNWGYLTKTTKEADPNDYLLSLQLQPVIIPDSGQNPFSDFEYEYTGTIGQFDLLALHAILDILERTKGTSYELGREKESIISHAVLENYFKIIKADKDAPQHVREAARTSLANKTLSYAQVRDIVKSYPANEPYIQQGVSKAKLKANSVKLGLKVSEGSAM